MDKIDIAIIRELSQGGLIFPSVPESATSNRQISKKLGITPGAVHYRIKLMHQSGVLKGSTMYPSPALLGLKVGGYTVDIPLGLKRDEIFQKLKEVEGVFSAHDFVGSRAWIVFVYKDEQDLSGKLKLFGKIAGPNGILSYIPFPPCPKSISRSEIELILHLSKKGFEGHQKLANDMSVSLRTIKRRMTKIVRENMILSIPNLDYNAMSNCVPVDLLIFFKDQMSREKGEPKVLDLIKDYVIFASLFGVVGMCSLILPKVTLSSDLAEKITRLDGVKEAWTEIVVEHMHRGSVIASYLEKQKDFASSLTL